MENNNEQQPEGTVKLLPPPQPRRGVAFGTKRGPYKKNTEQVEEATILGEQAFEKFTATAEQEEAKHEAQQHTQEKEEEWQEQVAEEQPQQQAQTQANTNTTQEPFKPKYNTDLFNGMFLLKMFDFVFPHLLKKVAGMFNKKIKLINVKKLRLEEDEKEIPGEIADELAPYIFGKISPIILGLVFMGYIYSNKISQELDQIPDEQN